MESAIKTGGIAFIKKPILGINSVKKANAPHTKAPGTPMICKKTVASTAFIKPPISIERIHPLIIIEIRVKATVALSRLEGGKLSWYNSNSGRG